MNGESIIGVPSNSQSHVLAIKHNTANPKYEVRDLLENNFNIILL